MHPTSNHVSYKGYQRLGGLAVTVLCCTLDAIIGTLSAVVNGVKSAEAKGSALTSELISICIMFTYL